jgi:hypothetical protein
MLTPARAQDEAKLAGRTEIKLQTVSRAYVDPDRINEPKALPAGSFDLAKLIIDLLLGEVRRVLK